MKRVPIILALVLALTLILAGAVLAAETLTVQMNAQNNSGQSGTATLEAMGNQTKVTIDIKPGPAGVPQPAHIHEGTCANLNPKPAFPLKSVENGKSETVVDVPLAQLQSKQHAINVHKSAAEAATYVSCGNIQLTAAQLPRTGGIPVLSFALIGAGLIVGGAGLWLALGRRAA